MKGNVGFSESSVQKESLGFMSGDGKENKCPFMNF